MKVTWIRKFNGILMDILMDFDGYLYNCFDWKFSWFGALSGLTRLRWSTYSQRIGPSCSRRAASSACSVTRTWQTPVGTLGRLEKERNGVEMMPIWTSSRAVAQ